MLLERSHNALFLRKLPLVDTFVCSYFPAASLKNLEVSDPSKREAQVQVLWQRKDVQAVFPVVCSSWAHFSLSLLVYIFLTTWQMQLSQAWVFFPPPLHAHMCSIPLKEKLGGPWCLSFFLQEVSHR